MHRFFAVPEDISETQLVLRGEEAGHARKVLRMKAGDLAKVLDGRGNLYQVKIASLDRTSIYCKIISSCKESTESKLDIRLGQVLLKGNKFDAILRQSVELGVGSVSVLQSENSVVRISESEYAGKLVRWEKIARSAAKQCRRSHIPPLTPGIQSVSRFCQDAAEYEVKLILWENEMRTLRSLHFPDKPASVAFLVGPEGGFTSDEVAVAEGYNFQSASLGNRILRSETVPLAFLTILQNKWGDLG
jgi:16S rRNA (uracil1498-N3)-methyltransferase